MPLIQEHPELQKTPVHHFLTVAYRRFFAAKANEILAQSLVCSKCGRTYNATVKENMYVQANHWKALCPRCKPRRSWNGGR